ncbi:MAG: hydroxypyruvate isomerase family protein [Alphaproteobacteria bacterium]|nr:hydroxypyruvate isomerase family protein [Alphaproteobacteria bacterium]MDE1985095.1 hydroxypyruvate isomerase family protein [Alphaproteobacteria bacterium]MDE2161740.1 hydroxypyruvate isomerase family protein [Alphaproteobacteria bacterium]MDE2265055.1 hydroxypyruvate isomerase family protein [Alphaproteobacteria bacterium]
MPRFAANLSMMYNEHSFLDRFGAATADGFKAVEYLFPYEHPAATIRERLQANGLEQALFNASAGDWAAGWRGYASMPGYEETFRRSIDQALSYAQVIGNKLLHVMSGKLVDGEDPARQLALYKENVAYAADQAAAHGITIVLEAINRRDMPGYFLNHHDTARDICAELDRVNLKVMFDAYHTQINDGDLATRLKRDLASIGHIQVASVPARHEPDDGEVNYPYLFKLIDELGYPGWIGCEYRPAGKTSAGLGWFKAWR